MNDAVEACWPPIVNVVACPVPSLVAPVSAGESAVNVVWFTCVTLVKLRSLL